MRRLVLDTSVILAGLRSRGGASQALLRLVGERVVTPLAAPALFLEYEEVLKRPEQRIATGLSIEQLDLFLAALSDAIEPVELHYRWRPQVRDPADEMVLEVAINGRADALVTHNVRDFAGVARRFGIPLLRPGEVLKRIWT
jgi:putative PIN family toxin of toxin-antitoxin system